MTTMEVQLKATKTMFSRQNIFSRALHGRKTLRLDPVKLKVAQPVQNKPGQSKSRPAPLKRTRVALGELQCQNPQAKKECPLDLSKLNAAINDVAVKTASNVVNIDVHNDYFHSPAYAQDIIDYNHTREEMFHLPRDYLSDNLEIMSNSRAILADWLISVQNYYQIESETMHLAVALLDQFLARRKISLRKLQLFGITCLLVAAKFNERFPPTFETLVTLTENAYTEQEVVKAELLVLKTLEYDVNVPIPNIFLDRYMKVVEAETSPALAKKVGYLANYLLDLSLTDVKVVPVLPSIRAAGAVWLARRLILTTLGPDGGELASSWSASMAHYTAMSEDSVQPMVQRYAHLLIRAENDKLQGARSKHSSRSRTGAISHDPAITNTERLSSIVGKHVKSL